MVLRKQESGGFRAEAAERGELPAQRGLQVELVLEPYRHAHQERAEPARDVRKIGFEQSLELEQRLVVEDDAIDFAERYAGFRETVADGIRRETGVVLPAREALLLRSRDDAAVDDQGGGAVMVVGGKTENLH